MIETKPRLQTSSDFEQRLLCARVSLLDSRPDLESDLTRTMMLMSITSMRVSSRQRDWKFADGSVASVWTACRCSGQQRSVSRPHENTNSNVGARVLLRCAEDAWGLFLPSFGVSCLSLRRHRRNPVPGGPISTSLAALAMTLPGTGGCAVAPRSTPTVRVAKLGRVVI